ncbi:MAG: ABC transporter ATP-binding protein [Planctomycetota bacterium]
MRLRSAMAHYRDSLHGSGRLIVPHLACVAITGVIAASPPMLVGLLVDRVQAGTALLDGHLPLALLLLGGSGLVYLGLGFGRDHLVTVIGERAGCRFQCALYDHLQRLSADFYQASRVGEITARLTHDVDRGVRPLYRNLVEGLTGLVMLLTASCCLAWYAPSLFAVFAGLATVSIGLSLWALPAIHRNFRALQDDNGHLNAQITEAVSVHSLVRAVARERDAQARMQPLIDTLAVRQVTAERFLWRFLVLVWSFELVLGPFLLLLVGARLIAAGESAGAIAAAVLYWRLAAEFKWKLTNGITGLMSGFGALARAVAFFTETPLVADRPDARPLPSGPGAIDCTGVVFTYPSARDDFRLGPVDLHVPAGSRCALLGPSGGGKSTIAQLLCRIYDPDAGRIRIDGVDIATVTQASLRRRIGFMTQETQLFDGDLATNLRFAAPDATDAELRAALQQAALGDLLDELPEGLGTPIGERGIRLSGGQRQRLAIARLLLLDPAIIVLDEVTAALDADSEAAIWTSIDHLFTGRTQLVITHRIASALLADRVAVIDQGRLLACGSPQAVHRDCSRFRELCAAQHVHIGGVP